jgi:hypothetical protein
MHKTHEQVLTAGCEGFGVVAYDKLSRKMLCAEAQQFLNAT